MTITMNISHIQNIEQIRSFLKSNAKMHIGTGTKQEVYDWIKTLLTKLGYHHKLSKKEKGEVKRFLRCITNYSDVQIKRLISKHKK